MTSDSFIGSANFDAQLIQMGLWDPEEKKLLENWTGRGDKQFKKTLAAFLISHLILRLLDQDCSIKGRVRARRIGDALSQFEQLLISTRGLENKFYRDHLNHAIRVALIARAIAGVAPFNLSNGELDQLVLACLFHDISYPLSESTRIFRSTLNAMKKCYLSAEGFAPYPLPKLAVGKSAFSTIIDIDKGAMESYLKELDHGLLGAIEFLKYLRPECYEKYSKVARAIAFHSPSFREKVISSEEPILALLIISDELQDWGRPTINESEATISRIADFQLNDNLLEGCFDARAGSSFSPLRQLYGKSKNLSRLILPPNFRFRIVFPLKSFVPCDFLQSEKLLQHIFTKAQSLDENFCSPQDAGHLYKEDNAFEESYYGLSTLPRIKEQVFVWLDNGKLQKESPFSKMSAFFDSSIEEIVFSRKPVKEISHLELVSSEEGNLILLINGKEKLETNIHGIDEPKAQLLSQILVAEMRFLNISIQAITTDVPIKFSAIQPRESFPSKEDLNLLTKRISGIRGTQEHVQLFKKIRNCIIQAGFFVLY